VLYALGEDPGVVMDEMGHTDPGLALRVYRQAMRRGEEEKEQLRALWKARISQWVCGAANRPQRESLAGPLASESKDSCAAKRLGRR
jgi:hypothetical protein